MCIGGRDPKDTNHTPQLSKAMNQITHSIGHIRNWYGATSFIRTLATAGLVPISNEGITYDAEIRLNETDGTRRRGYFEKTSKEDCRHKLSLNGRITESYFDMDNGHYAETSYKHRNGDGVAKFYERSSKMRLKNFDDYRGSAGDDTVYGNNGSNTLDGSSGKNYINGRGGNDNIYFGYGEDVIVGGAGDSDLADFIGSSTLNVIDVIDFELGDSIEGVNLKEEGLYLVMEHNGINSYIHESTEFIRNATSLRSNSKTFEQLMHTVRFDVRDPDQEATREHFLVGSSMSEDFYGGAGRDNITGIGGLDKFHQDVFDRSSNSWGNMDRILDFDSKDKIVIHSSLLGINPDDAGFEIVSTNLERQIAMSNEDVHFAYDTRSGDMFWDSNGAIGGGGRGLVKLVGDSAFSGANQIEFV